MIIISLGIVLKLIAIGKNEDTLITNFERWLGLAISVLLLLGIIFVGTGLGI